MDTNLTTEFQYVNGSSSLNFFFAQALSSKLAVIAGASRRRAALASTEEFCKSYLFLYLYQHFSMFGKPFTIGAQAEEQNIRVTEKIRYESHLKKDSYEIRTS